AASIVLLLSIAIFVIAGMNQKGPELLGLNDQAADSAKGQVKPEVKKEERSDNRGGGYTDNGGGLQPVRPVNGGLIVKDVEEKEKEEEEKKKEEGNKETGKKGATGKEDKKEPVKKEEEKQKEKEGGNKEPIKKEDPPPPPPDKKEDEKKEEKKREPKTIRIAGAPEVPLYLREPLTANASEGQLIYFNVTSPVRYNGDVIIERGATATGRIKNVGNKKISIVITKVTAANGDMLPLQEVELSGRINDMISNRSYSVPLKRGITIQL
ncbi:MAG: hypothetical protein ACXWB9_07135, partial [Flavisolibacter sp.]